MRMRSRLGLRIDRTLANKGWKQLWLPLSFISVNLVAVWLLFCAMHGFYFNRYFCAGDPGTPQNSFDAAFYYLFANGGQNLYPGSHVWGAVITILGLLCVALMTAAFTNIMDKRAMGYLTGETAYNLRGHIVIMGTNDVIYSIIQQKASLKCDFLIQTTRNVEETRRVVLAFLRNKVDENRLIFIYGDRTSEDDIARLSLHRAKEVFVIGDNVEKDPSESYRDAYNMDCINAVTNYLDKLKKEKNIAIDATVPYHVLFEYQTTFAAFQFSDILSLIKETVNFKPFNFYEMWAQQVFVKGYAGAAVPGTGTHEYNYKFLDALPSGGYITEDSEQTVHFVIVGMSKMGIAMAIEAAHICHFANYVKDNGKKTKITFIDENADVEKDFFMGRFKDLFKLSNADYLDVNSGERTHIYSVSGAGDWLDIEWEFIKGRVEQPAIQQYLEDAAADKSRTVTIAVCIPESNQAIAASLYLPDSVYDNCLQILTYQRLSGYIINNIANETESPKYRSMRPFGMIDLGYNLELDDDSMAMMVDYVYSKDYELKEYSPKKYLSQWLQNKVSNRWSSIFNANTIGVKLRTIGCSPQNDFDKLVSAIDRSLPMLMQVEHNRWNIEKLLMGFRPLNSAERQIMEELLTQLPEDLASADGTDYYKKKGVFKNGPHHAHLDLCSCKELQHVDRWAISYDFSLCKSIPYIIQRQKDSNVLV